MYVCCSSDVELEAAEVNGRLQNKCKCIMTWLVTCAMRRAMTLKGQINRGNEVSMVTLQVTVTACMDAWKESVVYTYSNRQLDTQLFWRAWVEGENLR